MVDGNDGDINGKADNRAQSNFSTAAGSAQSEDLQASLRRLEQEFAEHVSMSEKQNSKMLSSIQKCTADILQHTEKIVDSKVAP
eukprot:593871-Karenia_brevis.AAC.1